MNDDLFYEVMTSAWGILVAVIVWAHFRKRKYPASARYSTFGPRLGSAFVDGAVFTPLSISIAFLNTLQLHRLIFALLSVLPTVAWMVYTVWLHTKYGQTVGKMAAKVRVVDVRTESSITFRQAFLREGIPMVITTYGLVYNVYLYLKGEDPKNHWGATTLLNVIPGIWFLAEVITMLTNEKRRALHDMIAGTVVIRTNIDSTIAEPAQVPQYRDL